MTVEEVTELYINQGENMLETAQALNVNLSYLRAFMQRNRITKDVAVMHKIDSARKAQERWKMLSSSAMDKDGDMSG